MSAKYDLYLNGDCWIKVLRRCALERAKYICQARMRCSGARAVEVHHISYKSVGNEAPLDLLAVCSACHRALHDRPEPALKAANDNKQLMLFDDVG
jgi:hypothetical protein